MGAIRTLLGIIVLLAIIIGGYWVFATYTITTPNDQMWIEVNSRLPEPARRWSCTEVKNRVGGTAAQAPLGCEGLW